MHRLQQGGMLFMFEIRMGNAVVGNAEIEQKGLYYHIKCACKPTSSAIHRIIIHTKNTRIDLGICVPAKEVFTLSTQVPVKKLQGEGFVFELVNAGAGAYAVSDNMPFDHLDKLDAARLQHTNGRWTIVTDPAPIPQGSGQSRKCPNR